MLKHRGNHIGIDHGHDDGEDHEFVALELLRCRNTQCERQIIEEALSKRIEDAIGVALVTKNTERGARDKDTLEDANGSERRDNGKKYTGNGVDEHVEEIYLLLRAARFGLVLAPRAAGTGLEAIVLDDRVIQLGDRGSVDHLVLAGCHRDIDNALDLLEPIEIRLTLVSKNEAKTRHAVHDLLDIVGTTDLLDDIFRYLVEILCHSIPLLDCLMGFTCGDAYNR